MTEHGFYVERLDNGYVVRYPFLVGASNEGKKIDVRWMIRRVICPDHERLESLLKEAIKNLDDLHTLQS